MAAYVVVAACIGNLHWSWFVAIVMTIQILALAILALVLAIYYKRKGKEHSPSTRVEIGD